MRGITLLISILAVLCVPSGAMAQTSADDTTSSQTATPTPATGGTEYGADPAAPPRVIVPGSKAVLMDNGFAAAPADAPPQVQEAIFAANKIQSKPYRYGGGHARFEDTGYDCSGTVSYALRGAGLLKTPLDSSSFMSWGEAGKGDWITVYTNPGHAYVVIAGLRLDTSAAAVRSRARAARAKGPRWRPNGRPTRGFVKRHPAGF